VPAGRERSLVVGLALAGLVLRLIVAVALPLTPASDSSSYHQLGASIAEGHGFVRDGRPETVWAPVYCYLVGAVYTVAGARWVAVYVVQAFLDVGFCLLLWWWTRRRVGAETALLTLGLAVLSVSAIGSVRLLRTESVAAWLLVAALATIDLARGHKREALLTACGGALLGALTLSRWQFSLFPLFVGGALLVEKDLKRAALVLGAYAIVLTPWLVRNQYAVGAPVLSTQTGTTLYMSHFRNPGQSWGINTWDATTQAAAKMEPLAANNYLVTEALHRLTARQVLRWYPEKVFYLLVPFDWEVLRDRRTFNPTYFLIALFALVGVRAAWRADRRWLTLLVLPLVYLIVMALPFYGSPRFRLPVEPLLAPIAAVGVMELWRRRQASPASTEAEAA